MQFLITALNGLGYGLLLFLLGAGLTLIFSMMGVLNFAHASFYMLGAYVGYSVARSAGYWPALLLAPLAVGLLGALFERFCLRPLHRHGQLPELLVTFGLSYVLLEVVQLLWGRTALDFRPPPQLQGAAFTLVQQPGQGLGFVWGNAPAATCSAAGAACSPFAATRAFLMAVAVLALGGLWLLLTRSRIGLVIQAALTHPDTVQALGHDVPRIFMLVFGAGAALAALAGVIGGSIFVTEPGMAGTLGSLLFVVVVVGGLGSLAGAFLASLLIGLLQTAAASSDLALGSVFGPGAPADLRKLTLAQVAPMLPYLLLVLMLLVRPRGLLGTRDD